MRAHSVAMFMLCSSAFAQPADSYVGDWDGQSTSASGRTISFKLRLNGDAGTWRQSTVLSLSGGGDPCLQITRDVKVNRATADLLEITVSPGTAGCATLHYRLRRVSPNQLEGLRNGRPLTFTRN